MVSAVILRLDNLSVIMMSVVAPLKMLKQEERKREREVKKPEADSIVSPRDLKVFNDKKD